MPQSESQVWNTNGDVTEGYWIIQVFVLSANFQKKFLLHCFFVPFDVMGSNLKEPQRRRIILYGFLFIGLKHFQCLFKRTKGSQKMFNFAVSIVRFQLIKAKSLPSWQAMLWAFIHERAAACRLSLVSKGLLTRSCFPCFPDSDTLPPRWEIAAGAPGGRALNAELAVGHVPLFRGQNSLRTVVPDAGRGCAAVKFGLSIFHIYGTVPQADNLIVIWEHLLDGRWCLCSVINVALLVSYCGCRWWEQILHQKN